MAQLQAISPPIGLFEQFVTTTQTILILQEKLFSLSGDSFDIRTVDQQPIFKVQGRHMTLSGRKSVMDMSGNHLFDIVKELLHLHATYVAEDPQKRQIMNIKSAIRMFGSKANIEVLTREGKMEILCMEGNWRDTSADIVIKSTGVPVARIDRQYLKGKDWFGGKQTYALIVAPGVDLALMVAACIALDEKNNEG